MKYFYILIFTLVILAGFTFAFQNIDTISLKFLAWQVDVIVGLIILASLFAGIIITLAITLPRIIGKNYQIKKLNEELGKLKEKYQNDAMTFETAGLGAEGEKYKLENR